MCIILITVRQNPFFGVTYFVMMQMFRMEIVRKHKLCYKCLGSTHNARNCRSTMKCYTCRPGNHHTAICKQKNTAMSSRKSSYWQSKQTPNVISLMTVNQNPVLLQTIRVTVSDVREIKKGTSKHYLRWMKSKKPTCLKD